MSKYKKYGMGWFGENHRHSLAAKGVKTGRNNYAKDITLGGVSYSPVSVAVPEEIKEKSIMDDVDQIVAESKEEGVVQPEELQYETTYGEEKQEGLEEQPEEKADEVETEIDALEAYSKPEKEVDTRKGWEKLSSKLKDTIKDAYQSYRDLDSEGLEDHISHLQSQKEKVAERIAIIKSVKEKVLSAEYRAKVGVAKQLKELEKIDKILEKPQNELNHAELHIKELTKRVEKLNRPAGVPGTPASGAVPRGESIYSSIFPSFGEIMRPDTLGKRGKDENRFEKEKKETSSVFPSFDEIMHPEKLRGKK